MSSRAAVGRRAAKKEQLDSNCTIGPVIRLGQPSAVLSPVEGPRNSDNLLAIGRRVD